MKAHIEQHKEAPCIPKEVAAPQKGCSYSHCGQNERAAPAVWECAGCARPGRHFHYSSSTPSTAYSNVSWSIACEKCAALMTHSCS